MQYTKPGTGGKGDGATQLAHICAQYNQRNGFTQGLHQGGVGAGDGGRGSGVGGRGGSGVGGEGGRGCGRGVPPPLGNKRNNATIKQMAHPIQHAPHNNCAHLGNSRIISPTHRFTQPIGSGLPLHCSTHGITTPIVQTAAQPQAIAHATTIAAGNACG